MRRRKYLAAVGLATSLGLAGCSGGTGGNNSSGNGSGGGGGGETEAGGGGATETGGAETTAASGGEEATTEGTGGATEAETTETEMTTTSGEGEATPTSGESGGESTTTAGESGSGETTSGSGSSGGGSSSISDSGDTDVSLQEVTVDDGLSLDSAAFYIENGGFSAGVRGEVTNTSDSAVEFLEINALFYDSEGTRLGDGFDSLSELGGGETYKYDALYLGSNEASQIASYNLEVTSGF